VVQSGYALSTVFGRGPAALLTPPRGGFYWPGAGLVTGSTLRAFELGFRATGAGGWDFAYTGSAVATFALPSLTLVSVSATPQSPGVQWGSWVLNDGSYTYIYGVEDTGLVKYVHVARVPLGQLSAPWQYDTGSGWSSEPGASARILSGVSNQFSVVRIASGYALITQDAGFSRAISAYMGATPAGPFGASKTLLYTTPDWGAGTFTYNAVAHPDQGGAGGLLVSYNVNYLAPGGDYSDATVYRPHFIRVPLSCFPS
jgi:hypothetical protein